MTITPYDGHDRSDDNFDRVVFHEHQSWWQRLLSAAIDLVREPGWVGALKVAFLASVFVALYLVVRHFA